MNEPYHEKQAALRSIEVQNGCVCAIDSGKGFVVPVSTIDIASDVLDASFKSAASIR